MSKLVNMRGKDHFIYDSILFPDEGYYTEKSYSSKPKDRSRSETRAEQKKSPVRNETTQTQENEGITYLVRFLRNFFSLT